MSEKGDPAALVDLFLRPFLEHWTGHIQQTEEAAKRLQESWSGSADSEAGQLKGLDALRESIDAYLRSPLFLQMLKTRVSALIAAQRQANAFGQKMARQFAVSPTSEAAELRQWMDDALAALQLRLRRIEDRIEAIERRLGESSDAE